MTSSTCDGDEVPVHEGGFVFCRPPGLDLRVAAPGREPDLVLNDNRNPDNFFGFKIRLRARARRDGETLADAAHAVRADATRGAIKREPVSDTPRPAELAGHEALEVRVEYGLDGEHVTYTDPDGHERTTGEAPMRVAVVSRVALIGDRVWIAQLHADVTREPELAPIFERVLATLAEDGT